MTWTIDPRKFGEEVRRDHRELCQKAAILLDQRLVLQSPVGNPDLWQENQRNAYRRETYNLFAEALGARPMSKKKLNEAFPNVGGKGYVGGRFRGNWQVGVGSAPTGELPLRSAEEAMAKAATAAASAPDFPVIFISNNLPYAVPLNHGHSSQAPSGFVENAIDAVVAQINRGEV
eukprot:TRINITY_DN54735_c0_g1_i3.p1 TRINITY_DN54735_c0_g1~~TRINITY_DN54735_c0_g1_i3.p1  ORF type:complete len:175 (-),score=33.99 TRINITY_DN54735_c0_g1_i3:567-1091(-)